MKKVRFLSLLAVSATLLTFSSCTKDAKEDQVSKSNKSVAQATAASCGSSDAIRTVFMSMGHSSNGIWGLNASGTQVASERNYNPNGTVLDGVVNPMIYGNTGNLPCDLMNFSAVGGAPHWFGGRHNLGVGDDFISGSESLTVELGAGLTGRRAKSAVMNLTGTAASATVQLLLNGVAVGSPQTVTPGNAKSIYAGVLFNGLRISANGSGNVSITGTPGRPRQAIQFNLVSATPACAVNAVTVFVSGGNGLNGAWGRDTKGTQVASERNYTAAAPGGTVDDQLRSPEIVGKNGNRPCDLLNFSAIGGTPFWSGSPHTLGVDNNAITGTEALIVELGAGFEGRAATSAAMNLIGSTGASASVQPLLDGVAVGSAQTVPALSSTSTRATINTGVLFNGLRISSAAGTVNIRGGAGIREMIQFNLAQ